MFSIVDDSELKVPPLTDDELRWVHRFKRCLSECPERLEFMTTGDQLYIVDGKGARESELCDGQAFMDGIVLATMPGPICHGVS